MFTLWQALARAPYRSTILADFYKKRCRAALRIHWPIDAFFRDMTDFVGLAHNRVLFILDGMHYPEPAAAARDSYFEIMREAFKSKAEALGYEFIDLDRSFFARYLRAVRHDGHWNAIGQRH